MPYSFHEVIILAVLLPETLAVLAGIVRFKHLPSSLRYLVMLVSFGFAIDILMRILRSYRINNHFLISLYIPVEFWLIACIYLKELKNKRVRQTIPVLIIGLIVYVLWARFIQAQNGLNPVERFLEGLCIVCFSLIYFYETLKHVSTKHLEHTPIFWLSAGLFIYFACDIIIFIFSNFILSSYSTQFNYQLWDVHAVLTIILYLFYTLALWINPKN